MWRRPDLEGSMRRSPSAQYKGISHDDTPMTDSILNLFKERGALLEGHFLLSSGLHSPRYLQSALVLMDPAVASRLGAELGDLLRPLVGAQKVDAVVGPALGGVIVAHEVARALGCRALFTERLGDTM